MSDFTCLHLLEWLWWNGGLLRELENSIFCSNLRQNHAVWWTHDFTKMEATKIYLTSLLHGGRKHVFTRWQRHKESERDHPEADGEVGQHLDSSQEPKKKKPKKQEWATVNIKINHENTVDHKSEMILPQRMGNTLEQSTGRPCNGSPPPTLVGKQIRNKDAGKFKISFYDWHLNVYLFI